MKKFTLPRTDLSVSQVCLGSSNIGSSLSPDDSFQLLDRFVERGGNFIDTARVYADWLPDGSNASESTIGTWMRQRRNRSKVIIGTKGAHPHLSNMYIPRLGPVEIRNDIETSLHYLQTDVIDFYWLHRDDVTRPVSDILETLNKHVALGNIRYFGCSNWTVTRIRAALAYAEEHNIMGFVANQPMWSLAKPNRRGIADKTIVIADEVDISFHRETHLALIPFTSQAKGYFSKLQAGTVPEADQKVYDNAVNRARFTRIQEVSAHYQVNIASIVLSYLISQPFPVVPVIGASNVAQLDDSLQHVDLVLSPEAIAYLEQDTAQ